MKIWIILLPLMCGERAYASALRAQEADSLLSSSHSTTWSLPSGGSQTLLGSVANAKVQESPVEGCNGVNTTLTFSNSPQSNASLSFYLDGIAQVQGSGKDYTISGAVVTLTVACATGQIPYAIYSK